MRINTSIEFGGFYGSIHQDNIDYMIDDYLDYDGELSKEQSFDDIYEILDIKETENDYIRAFCNNLDNHIYNEYNISLDFQDLKLWSPRFYNFETDKIDCTINKKESKKLIKIFKKDNEFLEFLKDRTTSRDGFHSFYTYNETLDDDELMVIHILSYICNNDDLLSETVEFDLVFKDNEIELEQNRRDEKNGLYPHIIDDTN